MVRALTAGLAATLALAGVGASAQEPAEKSQGARACFPVNDVRNWEGVRGAKVIIRTGRDDFFEASFIGPCPEIDFAQQIVIHPRTGYRVCEGDDVHITIVNRATCRADRFRKLSADEVAALPPRRRP